MLEEDYSSDSNDEDYQPTEGVEVSEEEESGEEEVPLEGGGDDDTGKRGKRKKVNSKKNEHFKKRSQKETPQSVIIGKSEERKEMEKKKKEDDLWADFMKDVTPVAKNKSTSSDKDNTPNNNNNNNRSNNKVTVVTEYKFAGETVKVTSEVDADSKETKSERKRNNISSSSSLPPSSSPSSSSSLPSSSSSLPPSSAASSSLPSSSSSSSSSALSQSTSIKGPPIKRPSSGISNILDKINKKPKLSVLNKSLLDWNDFKKEEGIDEELKRHNKGKNGYLERMAFLQRTDLKQFEIEKSIRTTSSRK